MANALFTATKKLILDADLDLLVDDIKLVCVDHGTDTPVPATDAFLSDITAGARIATSGNFASKSTTGGVFDAADITLSAVSGASFESIVIYKDTGSAATSPLIVFVDTATGLPTTPNGGDINIVFDNGASKIFAI